MSDSQTSDKQPDRIQSVFITFTDGSRHEFVGKACREPGDKVGITKIEMSVPIDLPPGYSLETIMPKEGE